MNTCLRPVVALLTLSLAGCAIGPRFPELCGRRNAVVVGRVVTASEIVDLPLAEYADVAADREHPLRDRRFPHREVGIAVDHVDACHGSAGITRGDTVRVLCMISDTSGTSRVFDRPVCDWTLGQEGIFVLWPADGSWRGVEHHDRDVYLKARYFESEMQALEDLTSGSRSE